MDEPGILVTCPFGGGLTVDGRTVIELTEPVACFKVYPGGDRADEHILGIESGDGIPTPDGGCWVVHRPTFTSSNVTLAHLVNREWLLEVAPGEPYPPGYRMEFSRNVRQQEEGGAVYRWVGSGADLITGEDRFCLLEGDSFTREVDGKEIQFTLENLKGRSGVQFRVRKPREVQVRRVIG